MRILNKQMILRPLILKIRILALMALPFFAFGAVPTAAEDTPSHRIPYSSPESQLLQCLSTFEYQAVLADPVVFCADAAYPNPCFGEMFNNNIPYVQNCRRRELFLWRKVEEWALDSFNLYRHFDGELEVIAEIEAAWPADASHSKRSFFAGDFLSEQHSDDVFRHAIDDQRRRAILTLLLQDAQVRHFCENTERKAWVTICTD